MPIYEAITLALNTIRAQKLKSFFSLIGAFIGVMFLIAVVSIVKGMDKYVQEDFAAKIFGINTFTVNRRPGVQFGNPGDATRRAWRRRPQLYEDDYHAIRAALPSDYLVAIESSNQAEGVVGTKHSAYIQVSGVSEDLFKIRDYQIPFMPTAWAAPWILALKIIPRNCKNSPRSGRCWPKKVTPPGSGASISTIPSGCW